MSQLLQARAAVRKAVRAYFEAEGFLEVETPLRVRNPGQEVHIDAVPSGDRWLVTSPEYHMKRLVAAGHCRIFQMGRAFRAGEKGPHHEPEFTMLEWYRAEPSLDAIARDCERVLEAAGVSIRLERTTVRDLWRKHVGAELEIPDPAPDGWDDGFFQTWLDRIEPHLGNTFVFDWPVPLGALARRKADDPKLVERFELYTGGLELVNAFGELVDPVEQRARFEAEAAVRRARGKAVYPVDERLIEALGRMPPTCGAAMGFDRLVMLATGAKRIQEVVAFPDPEV